MVDTLKSRYSQGLVYLDSSQDAHGGHTEVQVCQHLWVGRFVDLKPLRPGEVVWGWENNNRFGGMDFTHSPEQHVIMAPEKKADVLRAPNRLFFSFLFVLFCNLFCHL